MRRQVTIYLPPALLATIEARAQAAQRRGLRVSPAMIIVGVLEQDARRVQEAQRLQRQKLLQKWNDAILGAVAKAFRYGGGVVSYDDLLEQALIEANHAVTRFDPSKGAFGPYAVRWIQPALHKLINAARDELRAHKSIDDCLHLPAPEAQTPDRDQLELLRSWAGKSPKRLRALERVASDGSLSALRPAERTSLARFLGKHGLALPEQQDLGMGTAEAARILGKTDRQVRKLAEHGRLDAVRVDGEWRILKLPKPRAA